MNASIDKTMGTPAYQQLKKQLETAIDVGELMPGKRIPSEHELSRRYGIHRSTVRISLRQLATEGILHSVPGRGWFVAPPTRRMLNVAIIAAARRASRFMQDVRQGLLAGAERHGCEIEFVEPGSGTAALAAGIHPGGVPDALIWLGHGQEYTPELASVARLGRPIVVGNRQIFGSGLPFVAIDQYSGTRDLVTRLIMAGHRNIGCVTSKAPLRYVSQRLRAYRDTLTTAGIEPDARWVCQVPQGGDVAAVVRRYLATGERPTALFVAGEALHAGTFMALEEAGLRVPENMSVIAFDRPAEAMQPAIVCLEQPGELLGERLFALIRRLVAGERVSDEILPTRLIPGESIRSIGKFPRTA